MPQNLEWFSRVHARSHRVQGPSYRCPYGSKVIVADLCPSTVARPVVGATSRGLRSCYLGCVATRSRGVPDGNLGACDGQHSATTSSTFVVSDAPSTVSRCQRMINP